jgi:cell division protein FtsN
MKTRIYLIGLVLSFTFILDACKSKESAYKAAYEAARQKDIEESTAVEVTPVDKPIQSSAVAQKEKITVIDGSEIKQFNVIIGSFANKTNAVSLKERMEKDGYKVFLAQNSRGMYRVIIASYDDKARASSERESVKEKYYPNFQDAWILDNN